MAITVHQEGAEMTTYTVVVTTTVDDPWTDPTLPRTVVQAASAKEAARSVADAQPTPTRWMVGAWPGDVDPTGTFPEAVRHGRTGEEHLPGLGHYCLDHGWICETSEHPHDGTCMCKMCPGVVAARQRVERRELGRMAARVETSSDED